VPPDGRVLRPWLCFRIQHLPLLLLCAPSLRKGAPFQSWVYLLPLPSCACLRLQGVLPAWRQAVGPTRVADSGWEEMPCAVAKAPALGVLNSKGRLAPGGWGRQGLWASQALHACKGTWMWPKK